MKLFGELDACSLAVSRRCVSIILGANGDFMVSLKEQI